MKKNNSYIADDEIDLINLVRILWREKILILSVSIICGLLVYLYASFEPKKFITVIKLSNPPPNIFEPYTPAFINKNDKNIFFEKFISDLKLKFLSLDNLQIFVEESRDLDTFKKYLKSRNISAKEYFSKRLEEVKEKNIIIPNTYSLVFEKEILDGNIFLINYVEYVKKKYIIEFKKDLKLSIENRINNTVNAFDIAKLINLENPIVKSQDTQNQVITEPDALFYKGTKVLSHSINFDKKLLEKLENDQFNYNLIVDKGIALEINTITPYSLFLIGLFIGLILSFIIIFF